MCTRLRGILAPGATCVHGHGWVDDDHIWPLVHRLTEPGDKITKVPALCGHNTGQRLSAWVSMTTHDFEGGHKYCGRVREWELWETFSREDKCVTFKGTDASTPCLKESMWPGYTNHEKQIKEAETMY